MLCDEALKHAKGIIAATISGCNYLRRHSDPLFKGNVNIRPEDLTIEHQADDCVEVQYSGWQGYICDDVAKMLRIMKYLEREKMFVQSTGATEEITYVLAREK